MQQKISTIAEEVRFELTVPVKRLLFSRQVHSTTLPLLRIVTDFHYILPKILVFAMHTKLSYDIIFLMEPIVWQVYEFEHNEKTTDWFWIVGIIGITLAILAIVFNSVLFAGLISISTFAIIVLGNKEPHLLECSINKKGVKVHKTFYPYSNLEAFNLTEGYSPKLILKSSKFFMPLITVPIGNLYPDEIISTLNQILKHEEGLREPFAHLLMDYLGF